MWYANIRALGSINSLLTKIKDDLARQEDELQKKKGEIQNIEASTTLAKKEKDKADAKYNKLLKDYRDLESKATRWTTDTTTSPSFSFIGSHLYRPQAEAGRPP